MNVTINNGVEPEDTDDIGYRQYHGYISGTICFIGIFGNIFNIIIWTNKSMRTSAVNHILTALAVADLLTVSFFFIYANYLYTATIPDQFHEHTEAGMYLVLICFHLYIVASTLSSWFTISLAIFRYIKVCQTKIAKRYCNAERAKLTVLLVAIFVNLSSIPFYFYYEVYDDSTVNDVPRYWLRRTAFEVANRDSYQTALLWLYGVIMKIIPCIALIILSGLIIRELRKAELHSRRSLQSHSAQYSRTSAMLVTIVLIYVITALPIGIAAFHTAVTGGEGHFFYFLGYSSIGNLLNLCPITNATVNIFVYVAMSKQFRRIFLKLILRRKELGDSSEIQSGTISTNNILDKPYTQPINLHSVGEKGTI